MERFQTFTVLINNICRNIRKIKTEEMQEHDLKSPHVSCFYYLYKAHSLTAKELCDICDEDKAAISRSLEYLEAKGYIECFSKTTKRYKCPITLTESGRKIGAQIVSKVDALLLEVSNGLTEEERIILYKSLYIINGNLKKICERYN